MRENKTTPPPFTVATGVALIAFVQIGLAVIWITMSELGIGWRVALTGGLLYITSSIVLWLARRSSVPEAAVARPITPVMQNTGA